jgi:hypothetical protein
MIFRQPSTVDQGLRWSPPPRVEDKTPNAHVVNRLRLDDPLSTAVAVPAHRTCGRIAATQSLSQLGP